MNIQKFLLIFCWLTLSTFGQEQNDKNKNIKVLAKFISFEGGDKIQFAKFKIIKNLTDFIVNDTILVGYYNYKEPVGKIDNVLLTIQKYERKTSIKNYFICPNYDGKTNIQQVKIEYIKFDYWEGCETGNGDCKPITFIRTSKDANWFLVMPCGGSFTSLTISGVNFNKKIHLDYSNCPPILELTNLKNGQYSANMIACGLGGTVKFNLETID